MMFSKLGVWDTAHNNGVLIYLLMAEHKIELMADRGIHAVVGAPNGNAMVTAHGHRPSRPDSMRTGSSGGG
jgi:uncharacterized membrane protein